MLFLFAPLQTPVMITQYRLPTRMSNHKLRKGRRRVGAKLWNRVQLRACPRDIIPFRLTAAVTPASCHRPIVRPYESRGTPLTMSSRPHNLFIFSKSLFYVTTLLLPCYGKLSRPPDLSKQARTWQ